MPIEYDVHSDNRLTNVYRPPGNHLHGRRPCFNPATDDRVGLFASKSSFSQDHENRDLRVDASGAPTISWIESYVQTRFKAQGSLSPDKVSGW
jgi:hypothetical protein